MKLAAVKNQIASISFEQSLEHLRIGDFISIKENGIELLAQIFEISLQGMGASTADLKFCLIKTDNNQIISYNGFVPSFEAKLQRVSPDYVLNLLNTEQTGIMLGKISGYPDFLQVSTDFFKDRAMILAGSPDAANNYLPKLAKELMFHKKVLIIDCTGDLEIIGDEENTELEFAKKIQAVKDFRLPLNFDNFEKLCEKGLSDANLESKALIKDIFYEVQNYIKTLKDEFLPIGNFKAVIDAQYAQTPLTELVLLKNNLQKYAREGIFAQKAEDFKFLFESLEQNRVVILDLSILPQDWHAEYLEYIFDTLKSDSYVLTQLTETNSGAAVLKKAYKNKFITFCPCLDYSYKFLDKLFQVVKNILYFKPVEINKNSEIAPFLAILDDEKFIATGKDLKNLNFILTLRNNEPAADFVPQLEPQGAPVSQMNQEQEDEEEILTEEDLEFIDLLSQEQPADIKEFEPAFEPDIEAEEGIIEQVEIHEPEPEVQKLPVYEAPVKSEPQAAKKYRAGQNVKHVKYGSGTILKVVNYADKTLLSVNFEETGKRLLDPSLAGLEVI